MGIFKLPVLPPHQNCGSHPIDLGFFGGKKKHWAKGRPKYRVTLVMTLTSPWGNNHQGLQFQIPEAPTSLLLKDCGSPSGRVIIAVLDKVNLIEN
jgi:hypothetical protein